MTDMNRDKQTLLVLHTRTRASVRDSGTHGVVGEPGLVAARRGAFSSHARVRTREVRRTLAAWEPDPDC